MTEQEFRNTVCEYSDDYYFRPLYVSKTGELHTLYAIKQKIAKENEWVALIDVSVKITQLSDFIFSEGEIVKDRFGVFQKTPVKYESYQIVDLYLKKVHATANLLQEAIDKLETIGKNAESSCKSIVERIDSNHIKIDGLLYYIIDVTPTT